MWGFIELSVAAECQSSSQSLRSLRSLLSLCWSESELRVSGFSVVISKDDSLESDGAEAPQCEPDSPDWLDVAAEVDSSDSEEA